MSALRTRIALFGAVVVGGAATAWSALGRSGGDAAPASPSIELVAAGVDTAAAPELGELRLELDGGVVIECDVVPCDDAPGAAALATIESRLASAPEAVAADPREVLALVSEYADAAGLASAPRSEGGRTLSLRPDGTGAHLDATLRDGELAVDLAVVAALDAAPAFSLHVTVALAKDERVERLRWLADGAALVAGDVECCVTYGTDWWERSQMPARAGEEFRRGRGEGDAALRAAAGDFYRALARMIAG